MSHDLGGSRWAMKTMPRGLDFTLMAMVSSLKLEINMAISVIQKGKPKNTVNGGRKRWGIYRQGDQWEIIMRDKINIYLNLENCSTNFK